MNVLRALGVLALAWGLAACGSGAPSPVQPKTTNEVRDAPTANVAPVQEPIVMTPTPEPTKANLPANQPQLAPAGPGAQHIVQLARQDLAKKLNMSLEQVREMSVEPVEWPDTSLGCPQPGMMYAQMITPGFRVVLAANSQTVEYHTDAAGRRVVSCPK